MISDLRIAFRTLAKSPGFTAVAVLTLALGIGVNTTMFSLADALLYHKVAVPEPEQLVSIQGTSPQSQSEGFSFIELEEMRAHATAGTSRAVESLTTFTNWTETLVLPDRSAEKVNTFDVSVDFFATARIQPMLGRTFTAEEQTQGRNQVAILSHALWQSHFGGDPTVIGSTVRLNAEQVTIIGVMPPSFHDPMLWWGQADVVRPIVIPTFILTNRDTRYFNAIARLRAGATAAQANAELASLATRWAKDFPQTSTGRGIRTQTLKEVLAVGRRPIVGLLNGLAGFVLLIACANLANLQLARSTAKTRDLAIRSALGASRYKLIVHQLIESMVLAAIGGALGVLVALWSNAVIGTSLSTSDVGAFQLTLSRQVLAATFGLSLLTGLLVGLIPAWLASRTNIITTINQQSRGSTAGRSQHRMQSFFVIAEVTLALVLLAGAGMMINGFHKHLRSSKGWDTESLLTGSVWLPEQTTRYDTPDKRRAYIEKMEHRLAEIVGPDHTAICAVAPIFSYTGALSLIQAEGQNFDDPSRRPAAGIFLVGTSSDYFATLGIPLIEGRLFPPSLRAEDPPVIVVGQTLARHFWPKESAVGKRIGIQEGDKVVYREIIGIVRDVSMAVSVGPPQTALQIYKPLMHEPWGFLTLVIRGAAAGSFKRELQLAVSDIDADVAVQDLYTVPEAITRGTNDVLVINRVLSGFALLGLLLAAIGLYGVLSNIVAQRFGEFGIRLILGAKPSEIFKLVIRKGLILTLIGLVFGSIGSFLLDRLLSSLLPEVANVGPATIALVAVLLLMVAFLACWLPARRATRVNPIEALRAE